MRETGELLGYGLCAVFSLYNPEIIIVGGGMSRMGDRLLQYTREILDTHALRIPYGCCTIVTAVLGDAAGMLGAAVYAKIHCGNLRCRHALQHKRAATD